VVGKADEGDEVASTLEGAGAGQGAAEREGKGSSARRWLVRVGQIALLAFVTWALFRAVGLNLSSLGELDLAAWRPAAVPLALSAALLIAVYLLHALLWRRIVSDLIGERIAVGVALRIYFLANLGRYLPGRLWQVAGMAVLAQRAGVPPVGALAGSALAQLSFLLTGALFLTLSLPAWLGIMPALAAGAILALGTGALVWLSGTASGARARGWLGGRLGARVAAALAAVAQVRARHAARWLLGYALSWLLLGGAFALFTAAFVPGAATEFRQLAGTMSASYLSGYLAIFAPAGVGVREGVMGVLLARSIPEPAAIVVSVASRVWFTATELIVLMAIPFLGRQAAATGTKHTHLEVP
jgi:hypothetical protein